MLTSRAPELARPAGRTVPWLAASCLAPVLLVLSGCVAAGPRAQVGDAPLLAQANDLAQTQITPADPAARAAIRRQEPLAQATFWTREYDKNPADYQATMELSEILRKIGSYRRAAEIAQQGLALRPEDPALNALLGFAHVALEEGPQAIGPLEIARRSYPRDPKVLNNLGVALDQAGKFEQARVSYNAALAADPQNVLALVNLGLSHALSGDPRTAEVYLRQAVSRAEAPPQARQNLALALALQGKYAEAEEIASKGLSPEAARANISYVRRLMDGGRRWTDLQSQGAVAGG